MPRNCSSESPLLRFVIALGFGLFCSAGSAWSADFLCVYQLAEQNDPTLQSARYAYQAAAEKLPQAKAGLLPVLTINGNGSQARNNVEFPGVPPVSRPNRTWAWTVQVTQPLIRIANLYAYSEAEGIVAQAEAQYHLAEQSLILRVAQAYFDVNVAQESIVAADAQLRATEEQMAQAQHGFKDGTVAITDVHEAKSRMESARAQRIAALNDLQAKRAALEQIVGPLPEQLAGLRDDAYITPPAPQNALEWSDLARHNNPSVYAQEAVLATAEATIKRNRAEHLPTLDLVGSYGDNSSSSSVSNPVNYAERYKSGQIGLQLSIPIYSGGLVNSRVKEAIANRYKAEADLEVARRQAATDARVAYAGVINGLSQIDALQVAIDSGKSAVQGNQIGYKVGIRINLDVLTSQQQLYTAQRDYVKARYDTLLQGLKLKAAAGTLSPSDVLDINSLFISSRH